MGEAGGTMQQNDTVAYAVCFPHLPFMTIQDRALNAPLWAAVDRQAAALRAFDPQVVFVFGSDHYEGQHMANMPTFAIGHAAQAIDDRGGFPGTLRIPAQIARACAAFLVREEFDIANSHAMRVDHGFSAALHHLLGGVEARSVVPVFINALCEPRPTFRRCRKLGDAVGRFAATLGRRVAFIGSGGLSHETGDIFPQVAEVQDAALRDYLVHGGAQGAISREAWRRNLNAGLTIVNEQLQQRVPGVGQSRPEWDAAFIRLLQAGDLRVFDRWEDAEVLHSGGNGAGEVREWIAALAAAAAAGAPRIEVDHYEAGTCIGVAAAVVHAQPAAG
jgi:2,3-dihydroxyphenylpropionate 1,2-dioxygenase